MLGVSCDVMVMCDDFWAFWRYCMHHDGLAKRDGFLKKLMMFFS